MRVFHILLILHNLQTPLDHVWVHLGDDQAKSCWVPTEHVKEEFELVEVLLLEHVDTASVFASHLLRHLRNHF